MQGHSVSNGEVNNINRLTLLNIHKNRSNTQAVLSLCINGKPFKRITDYSSTFPSHVTDVTRVIIFVTGCINENIRERIIKVVEFNVITLILNALWES